MSPVVIERNPSARPRAEERPYAPRGAALELLRYHGREVLIAGPSGTGKSRAALTKLDLVCTQLPIRAAIVRKVRVSLTQSTLVTMSEKVLPQPSGVVFHGGDQEFRYPNGARIAVFGLDDPRKALSSDFDLIYVGEATDLDEGDWGILLTRLRNGVLGYQQILADCNPGDPGHWLKQRCDSGVTKLFESRHEDNPTLWDARMGDWTPFGRGYMETLDSLSGFQHQRLRLGQWVAAEGQYFSEWNPDVHVADAFEIPADWPRWISVDYGFAAPFCALWFAREPETRRIVTYREIYAAGLRDEQQAELIVQRSEGERIEQVILDPSMFNLRSEQNRPSIASVYAQGGVAAIARQGIYPASNNRKQGWATVRRALAHDIETPPRWTIMRERCPNLLRELPALVHDKLDPEDVADRIGSTAVSDHACDSARYGLMAEAIPSTETRPRSLVFGPR